MRPSWFIAIAALALAGVLLVERTQHQDVVIVKPTRWQTLVVERPAPCRWAPLGESEYGMHVEEGRRR